MRISDVNEVEDTLSVASFENIFLGELFDFQAITLLNHRRNLGIFLRNDIGHIEFVFDIGVVHLIALKSGDVLGVIFVVIDGGHGSQLVETPGEHAFRIHIGEAQWSHHLGHPVCASIVFHGL